MKKSRRNLAPPRLRICLACVLAAAGTVLASPLHGLAQEGAKRRQAGTQQTTQPRQERPAAASQESGTKAGGQSRGGSTKGNTTSEAASQEATLLKLIDGAVKKAEQSGAAKHPETSDRMSKLVEQVRVYKTKLVSLKDEELAEEFSGTGEPAGEAGEIIDEANAITDLATSLAKQTEGDQKDRQEQTDGGIDWLYLLSWLIWGLVGLLAIAALVGFALFLVKLNRRVGDLETMHGKVVQRFVVLEKTLGEQRAHALTVVSGVTRLRDGGRRPLPRAHVAVAAL